MRRGQRISQSQPFFALHNFYLISLMVFKIRMAFLISFINATDDGFSRMTELMLDMTGIFTRAWLTRGRPDVLDPTFSTLWRLISYPNMVWESMWHTGWDRCPVCLCHPHAITNSGFFIAITSFKYWNILYSQLILF